MRWSRVDTQSNVLRLVFLKVFAMIILNTYELCINNQEKGVGRANSRVKERTFDLPLLVNPNGRVSRIRLSSGVSHSRKRFITSINPPDLVSSSY